MSLRERLYETLIYRRNRILNGDINSIPLPFKRFRSEFAGLEKDSGIYYLVSGATKSAKTQITNYLFVFTPILYSYYHRDKVLPKIFYFPLEETPQNILLRFECFLLYTLDNIIISSDDLKSTNNDNPVSEEILDKLNSEKYIDIIDYFESCIIFNTEDKNPTGIYKEVMRYANQHGQTHYKKIKYIDDLGNEKELNKLDYYEPNNKLEQTFIIVDHVSLLETERGYTLRECINKLSEYMIHFRNFYKYNPVLVQQQNLETISLEAFKNNKIRPTVAGLKDSKATGYDCSMFIGITNPYSFELPEYLGYDITKLKSNFRCIEIVLNRNGKSNGICPLFFLGECCSFNELPLPTDINEMNKVYKYLDKIKEDKKKKQEIIVSLFTYFIKKFKKLEKQSNFNTFANPMQ